MNFEENCKKNFELISKEIFNEAIATEDISFSLAAENQTYLRFNNSRVRQATEVHQQDLTMILQSNGRKSTVGMQLGSNFEANLDHCLDALARARAEIHVLPDDPHLVQMNSAKPTATVHGGTNPVAADVISLVTRHTAGTDFTGFYAAGPVIRAMSNSHGQSHWFSSNAAFFDYSLYTVNSEGENKAIKSCYSEKNGHDQNFLNNFSSSKEKLEKMKNTSKKLPPGEYKVYLAPACFDEISQLLGWSSLSQKAHKDGRCPLSKLYEKKEKLSPKFTLRENFELGVSPQFTTSGDFAPTTLNLIQNGELVNFLINSRTAKEFGLHHNGAN